MPPRSGLQPQFGLALRQLRTTADFSQEELAARASIDTTYVSLLERGINEPTLAVVQSLALALGIRASELVKAAEDLEASAG